MSEFWSYLNRQGPAISLTQEQREALFREFLKWQKLRSGVKR
jgi:hypothetical protein